MRKPSPGRANARAQEAAEGRSEVARGRTAARGVAVARGVARAPVRAVRAPARAAVQVGRYWRAERRTLRQGFTALSVSSVGDLLAGLALGAMTGRLEQLPGLLILVPAVIGMRGSIFGALGSRLGTSIHAGMFKVTLERRGVLMQNAYAATLLSIASSAYLAVVARVVTSATGLPSVPVWDFVAISVIAGTVSGAVILVLTIILARTSYNRNWDLDSVAAPVITFMGDIVTLPSLFAASYITNYRGVTLVTGIALGVASVGTLLAALRTRLPVARRILRESIVMLGITGIVTLVAGAILEHRRERFLALPALFVLIPPFLEDAGALGGIVSARLTSKLHLGAIRARLLPDRLAWLDISLAAPFALSVFTLVGVSSHLVANAVGFASPGLGTMVAVSLLAGLLATIGSAIIAYAAAVATFRFGMDPDNHGIPIVTSSIDLLGMICLVIAIVVLKVG